jgi:hypothetical protein
MEYAESWWCLAGAARQGCTLASSVAIPHLRACIMPLLHTLVLQRPVAQGSLQRLCSSCPPLSGHPQQCSGGRYCSGSTMHGTMATGFHRARHHVFGPCLLDGAHAVHGWSMDGCWFRSPSKPPMRHLNQRFTPPHSTPNTQHACSRASMQIVRRLVPFLASAFSSRQCRLCPTARSRLGRHPDSS